MTKRALQSVRASAVALPAVLENFDELDDEVEWFGETCDRLYDMNHSPRHDDADWIARGQVILEELQELREKVRDAERWATRAEIAQAVTLLCAAYPNADGKDLSAFAFIAREDIARLKVSIHVLAAGCRRLRRKCKFLPSIAEMIETFRTVPKLENHHFSLAGFPKLLIEAEETFKRRAAKAAIPPSTAAKGDKT